MGKFKKYFFIIVLWGFVKSLMGTEKPILFSIPDEMELRTQFWINIFTKYSNHQMIIHDTDKPERIYKIVDFREYFPDGMESQKEKTHILKIEREKVVSILKKCAYINNDVESLSQEELRIYRLFGTNPTKMMFIHAAQSVRIQDGMKETFLEGLVRSGMYLNEIKAICRRYGLPEELAYLPHIESSFYPPAQSKYGAVGMWQFTRDTGKMYLMVRNEIDERRDPFLSTEAAAKHLKMLFEQLGSWPLAITAYNYGLTGMKRAVQKVRTTDLWEIIQEYNNRRFGFASKNFYAEFIAAVWVSEKVSQYFGQVSYDLPLRFTTYQLPDHYKLSTILEMFDIPIKEFKGLNPALRPPIFREEKNIPKGYLLRIPINSDDYTPLDSTVTEKPQSSQTIRNENGDQETGMWTFLFKNLKSWMITSFVLKYGRTHQQEDNRQILIQETKSENPTYSDNEILDNFKEVHREKD
ncbi:lytic transglycosylase domain-containing protein [bacterium]|nr:lytic transglycosylase domain-containing protein [bacterium]